MAPVPAGRRVRAPFCCVHRGVLATGRRPRNERGRSPPRILSDDAGRLRRALHAAASPCASTLAEPLGTRLRAGAADYLSRRHRRPTALSGRRLGAHRSFGCLLDTAVPPSRATLPVLSAHYSAGRHFGRQYAERDEAVALVKPHKRRRAIDSTANSQPQHSLSSLVTGTKFASPRPRLTAR